MTYPLDAGAFLVDLPAVSGPQGCLVFVESGRHIPFMFKRMYYFRDMPAGQVRGCHAHRTNDLVVMAPSGSFQVAVDDGRFRASHLLDRPDRGLFVPRMTWLEVADLSRGSVCLILASEFHEEGDQISDYDEFLRATTNGS